MSTRDFHIKLSTKNFDKKYVDKKMSAKKIVDKFPDLVQTVQT